VGKGLLRRINDPNYGEVVVQGVTAKFEKTPGRIKWVRRDVGADNEFVYLDMLGFTKDKLEELKKKGVI